MDGSGQGIDCLIGTEELSRLVLADYLADIFTDFSGRVFLQIFFGDIVEESHRPLDLVFQVTGVHFVDVVAIIFDISAGRF